MRVDYLLALCRPGQCSGTEAATKDGLQRTFLEKNTLKKLQTHVCCCIFNCTQPVSSRAWKEEMWSPRDKCLTTSGRKNLLWNHTSVQSCSRACFSLSWFTIGLVKSTFLTAKRFWVKILFRSRTSLCGVCIYNSAGIVLTLSYLSNQKTRHMYTLSIHSVTNP